MMSDLKKLFEGKAHHQAILNPSITVESSSGHTLMLKLDSTEKIIEASYLGKPNPWLSTLCDLILGMNLQFASELKLDDWKRRYGKEQLFWDLLTEKEDDFFFLPLEMLKAALDKYQGKEFLYLEESPLVCRCFGVREDRIIHYLQHEENPTLKGLGAKTKAGMSCRSCRPQLERWVTKHSSKTRYYKDRPLVDWIIMTEEHLAIFPFCFDWQMEVESFKGKGIVISYDKPVSQVDEEKMARELQLFLGERVDSGLAFFLVRSSSRLRQDSKA